MKWQKASMSNSSGNCVEMAPMISGDRHMVGVRNSRHPEGAVLLFTQNEIKAMFDGVRKGEFNHLIGSELCCGGMADYAAVPCEDPAHCGPDGKHLP